MFSPYMDFSIIKYGIAGLIFTVLFFYAMYKVCTYIMGED